MDDKDHIEAELVPPLPSGSGDPVVRSTPFTSSPCSDDGSSPCDSDEDYRDGLSSDDQGDDSSESDQPSTSLEPTPLDKLSLRQAQFVQFLVADPKRRGALAYMKAYPGTTPNSAAVGSHRMLKKAKVREAIKYLQDELSGRGYLEVVLSKLRGIIEADVSDVMEWDCYGNVKYRPTEELSPSVLASIASVSEVREDRDRRLPGMELTDRQAMMSGVAKINRHLKLHDPMRAIELLSKINGWFEDSRLRVDGGLTVRVFDMAAEEVKAGVDAPEADEPGGVDSLEE